MYRTKWSQQLQDDSYTRQLTVENVAVNDHVYNVIDLYEVNDNSCQIK